ncbi:MAG: TIGR02679 family protein [Acidimicrobiia bacterium]
MGLDSKAVAAASRRLSRPSLTPLVDALVARFEEGVPAAISLRNFDSAGLSGVADLLGSAREPTPTSRILVSRLLSILSLPDIDHLRAAVEAVRGPIDDRRAGRAAVAAERDSLWSWFDAEVAGLGDVNPGNTDLMGWASRVRAAGVRGGVTRHRKRLKSTLEVLRRLPADGTTLAALAADVLGDPHGLDRGRSVAALVLDALDPNGSAARDAEAARNLWEQVGVAPDALSSSVLALGLRVPPDHPLAGYLTVCSDSSEPAVLTLAQLRRWPLTALPPDATAYVVENPSVITEATRRGWDGKPPIVCSSGRPSVATLTLIRQLGADTATIRQHADFDPAGIGITAWLTDRAGTRPWRMSADDYRHAVTIVPNPIPLAGAVPPTPWDPTLATTMARIGVAAYEEHLRAVLLEAM